MLGSLRYVSLKKVTPNLFILKIRLTRKYIQNALNHQTDNMCLLISVPTSISNQLKWWPLCSSTESGEQPKRTRTYVFRPNSSFVSHAGLASAGHSLPSFLKETRFSATIPLFFYGLFCHETRFDRRKTRFWDPSSPTRYTLVRPSGPTKSSWLTSGQWPLQTIPAGHQHLRRDASHSLCRPRQSTSCPLLLQAAYNYNCPHDDGPYNDGSCDDGPCDDGPSRPRTTSCLSLRPATLTTSGHSLLHLASYSPGYLYNVRPLSHHPASLKMSGHSLHLASYTVRPITPSGLLQRPAYLTTTTSGFTTFGYTFHRPPATPDWSLPVFFLLANFFRLSIFLTPTKPIKVQGGAL